ncbi:hypothetical protein [Oscillibacter sp.]|uniref:hypothetical protein n=1 Tax=Oscillibacter sp. TaxID=1945593 RepID=UPI0028969C38|nr:hypothetical protein [Oscillibacter sp.]
MTQYTVHIKIPPVEKGVDKAVALLSDDIYERIEDVAFHTASSVEDLRVEISIDGEFFTDRYEKQFVYEREVYASYWPNLRDRVNYCMVKVERELAKKLTAISLYLYQ